MPNTNQYKFSSTGSLVKTDPIDEILNRRKVSVVEPPASGGVSVIGSEESLGIGTRKPMITAPTKEEAAASAIYPKTAPTAPAVRKTTAVPIQKDATIWNPKTGVKTTLSKEGLKIGDPLPEGFSLWTGGTATGLEAQQAIKDKKLEATGIPFGMSAEEARKLGYDPERTPQDIAADTLVETEEEEVEIEDEEPAEDKWEIPEITDILSGMGIDKMPVSDFTQDKQDLLDWRDNQTEEIDRVYEERFAEQKKANDNSLAAMQANMIKRGVLGGSIDSASAGEIARGEERVRKIQRDKASDLAKVRNSYLQGKMDLGKQERQEVWDAKITDISNMFQGYNLATNIWQAFNQRDMSEKKLEQDAQQHLENMNMEFYKMDEKARADGEARIQDNIEKGLYNMYNEDDVKLLQSLEQKYRVEEGEFTSPATGGYWNRMTKIMLDEAKILETEASTKYKEAQTEKMKKATIAAGLEAEEGGYPKGFWSAVKTATSSLQKGEKWGTVFDRMKLQFPSVDNTIVDKVLGGSWDEAKGAGEGWAESGAFEDWKSKQYKAEQPRQFELESDIWKQIANNPDTPTDVIKQWIMGEGFNPENFGY